MKNSGFGTGGDWDDQFDAMTEGWRIFLANLALHLEHFDGVMLGRAAYQTPWILAELQLELFDRPGVPDRAAAVQQTLDEAEQKRRKAIEEQGD